MSTVELNEEKTLQKEKESIELQINSLFRKFDEHDFFIDYSSDIENQLWAEAKKTTFATNQFLKQSVILKKSILKYYEDMFDNFLKEQKEV